MSFSASAKGVAFSVTFGPGTGTFFGVGKKESSQLSAWVNGFLGLVYPEVCQICGERPAQPGEGFVCENCWTTPGAIQFIRKPFCQRCGLPYNGEVTSEFECSNCTDMKLYFSFAQSAVVARRLVKDVIHRFKYRNHLWFDVFLADLLVRELSPWLGGVPKYDCLIPVPLHPTKARERGFNQSERIARVTGRLTGIPVISYALKRVRPTDTQTHLSRKQRAANMRKAFATTGRYPLKEKRVILLDDVFTTGATTNACARVLRGAGVNEVCVWTVARGI